MLIIQNHKYMSSPKLLICHNNIKVCDKWWHRSLVFIYGSYHVGIRGLQCRLHHFDALVVRWAKLFKIFYRNDVVQLILVGIHF
jgi:hypothetical protein